MTVKETLIEIGIIIGVALSVIGIWLLQLGIIAVSIYIIVWIFLWLTGIHIGALGLP